MKILENKITKIAYIYGLAFVFFIAWLLSYKANNEFKDYGFDIENVGFIVLGIIAFIVIAFIKDTFYMLPLLCFAPFSFARSFDTYTIPPGLYILVGCAVLGLIVHLIIYRTKLNKGVYFYSLLIFCIGIAISGLFTSLSALLLILIVSLICGILLFAYIFIVSYLDKHELSDLCHILTALGIILIAQTMTHELLYYPTELFQYKDVKVGWGISNNIALMLLMCFPFTIYLSIKGNRIMNFVYVVIAACEFLFIVLNYSRGAILCAVVVFPIVCIYAIIKSKHKLCYAGYYLVLLVLALLITCVFCKDYVLPKVQEVFDIATQFNIKTLNGRTRIYEMMLSESKKYPIFGKGLINSFYTEDLIIPESGSTTETYLWGHNAFIHTVYTCGLVGVVCFMIHLFDKYFKLLKNANMEKIFVCLALLGSGLYGLMDIAYYFINWMVVLIVIMAFMEHIIKDSFKGELNV